MGKKKAKTKKSTGPRDYKISYMFHDLHYSNSNSIPTLVKADEKKKQYFILSPFQYLYSYLFNPLSWPGLNLVNCVILFSFPM